MDRVAADDARWAGTAAIRQRLLHSQQELASTSAAELGSHELPFARLQSAASKPDLQAEAYRLLRLARIDEAVRLLQSLPGPVHEALRCIGISTLDAAVRDSAFEALARAGALTALDEHCLKLLRVLQAAYVSAADQSGAPETQQASQHAPVLPPLKWLQSLTPVELLCCLLDAPNAVMPASPAVLEHWPAVLGYCCRHHKAQEMMELLRSLPASTACAHYLVQRPANSTLLFSALYAETAAQHPSFLQAVQTVDGALLRLLARARQLMRQLAAPLTLSSADSSSSTPSTSALQAVFVQHARQQQLPFLLHHFLAGVVRESPWHSLEPWLQELVAGLFDSEQTRHMQHAYIQHALPGFQKDSSAPDRSLFSTYEGDITLMQLLEGVWPARLRPLLSLFCLADTNAAPFKVNAGTPDTQADMLAQAQQAVTGHQAPNTASLRLQHLVHKGRPLAALHTLLSGTPEAAGQPGRPDADEMLPWREEGAMQQLPASALHSLKALMNPSSLAHPLHKMDLATRVALLAMCGQPSWPLRVHSMAAQLHATSPHLQPPLNSLSPIPQAPLTTAELAAPGAVSPVTRGPGYAQSREILRLSAWHGGSLQQGSLLTYLAQTGDWMRFLAEAGSPLYPVEQVRSTVDAYVADPCLRHHMRHVLRFLQPQPPASRAGRHSASNPHATSSDTLSGDPRQHKLFDLLAMVDGATGAAGSLRPPLAPQADQLLAVARRFRWAWLPSLVAALPGVPVLLCLAAWLHASLPISPDLPSPPSSTQHAQRAQQALQLSRRQSLPEQQQQLQTDTPAGLQQTPQQQQPRSGRDQPPAAQPSPRLPQQSIGKEQPLPADSAAEPQETQQDQQPTAADLQPPATCADGPAALLSPSAVGTDAEEEVLGAISRACKLRRFDTLLSGLSMFIPDEPVRAAVQLLQSWAGGDVAAAERQLEGLQASAAHAQRTGAGGVPAHWSSQALWTAMDAVLQSPATPAEMQLLLGLLTRLDLGAPFGSGMARYRTLAEACQLLGQNAWEFVRWPAVGQRQAPLVDTDAVLAHLMERQDWPGARRWADGVIQVLHEVTRTEGKALVREWRLRAWQPELRPHCWDELARLFTEQGFPPACAARFLVAQADALLQADAITPREQYELLQEALAWLAGERGMKYDCPPGVLSALRSCLQLLAVNAASPAGPASVIRVRSDRRRSSSGSADQVEASMYPGQPQYADPFRQSSAGRRRESDGLSSSIAGEPDAQVAGLEAAALKQMHAILRLIHSRVTRQQLQQAVGQTLELGDVAAARQLSLGLASPPIELALVEAATACLADGSARNIPQAVLDFLRNKSGGLLRMDDPQEVLNALSAACRAGAGQSVCSRAAATFRAAGLLGLSPGEAGAMSSISILQWLLMKGPGHLQAAMDFAKAHALEPADLAQCLARAFLKGLMSQNDQAAGGAPAWTLEAVVACSKELAGDADLAGTLLRLLLDLHSGLEGSVEAELLVAAHHCYEASNSLECIDVLLELASAGVAAYQATQDFPALARIAAGLGGYQQLRGVIDYLLQHGQLDLLLQQLGPGGVALGATGRQMLRTAILAAIQRRQQQEQQQQPDEQAQHAQRSSQAGKAGKSQAEEPAVIVHRHFKMARESAADLGHSAAQMLRQAGEMGSEVTANLMRLEAMRAALEASAAYEAAEGPLAARRWASTAALTALQVQDPLTNWAALAAQARQDVRTPMPLDAIVLAYAWQPAAGTPAGR